MQILCSPLHQCWALEWYSLILYQTEQSIQLVMHLQQSEIILNSKRKACHWSLVWTNFMHTYLVTTSSCAQTTSPGWPCWTNIVLPMNCSTDHSPQASARIQWWLLQLSAYEYTLKFRDTFSHSNADVLSHLLMPVAPPKAKTTSWGSFAHGTSVHITINAQGIRAVTVKHPVLYQVFQHVQKSMAKEGSCNTSDGSILR